MSDEQKRFVRKPDPQSTGPLVGLRFFTYLPDGKRRWQGHIIAPVAEGIYLAEWFDWLAGTGNGMFLATLEEMKTWIFMDDSYDIDGMAESHKTFVREP